jgi:two-component system phosphate regulon response regulator OmpR
MPHSINHILVVDDDTRIRDLLGQYLIEQGFFVTTAKDAMEARRKLKEFLFDLLIVDVMMPGESGMELTASLRAHLDVPILMLTAMDDSEDRIKGLECGADDYLPKPFEPRELVLRIKKILQRTKVTVVVEETVTFGDCIFYPKTNRLLQQGKDVDLSSTEAKFLTILCGQPNTLVLREYLAQECGGINERSVDVQINRLRTKVEADPKKPKYLKTIRGEGYVLYTA